MIRAELDAELYWKRFHIAMEKYIPELGARQIESCAGVEVGQRLYRSSYLRQC
jgi:hypothetical protein